MAATTTNKPIQSKSSSFVYLQNPDELQKVFSQFDTNGDGKISVSELGDVLKALGTTVASKDLTQLMEDLDSDHDSFISLEESSLSLSLSFTLGGLSSRPDAGIPSPADDTRCTKRTTTLREILAVMVVACSVVVVVDGDNYGSFRSGTLTRDFLSNNGLTCQYRRKQMQPLLVSAQANEEPQYGWKATLPPFLSSPHPIPQSATNTDSK
ncbi:hypothetical protein G4B88_031352 [Cannabis sativa]|uniref:EF-hand domain-containing protein n=1 Tax=Cannabis sativa TaxID=3483 RepID=A0A7J6GED9_CANSA|nr:hypothetical protein G4B88_031352 [Cannabis sativa]